MECHSKYSQFFAVVRGIVLTFVSIRVWYDLVVGVDNALMKWSAEVKGKEVGVVDVRY